MGNFAREIATFMDTFDHWELMDSYGGVEEATMEIAEDLKRKESREDICIFLRNIAEDNTNLFEDRIQAARLYKKVRV